jgi:hypothetical protein
MAALILHALVNVKIYQLNKGIMYENLREIFIQETASVSYNWVKLNYVIIWKLCDAAVKTVAHVKLSCHVD